jgi:hypothetical protein
VVVCVAAAGAVVVRATGLPPCEIGLPPSVMATVTVTVTAVVPAVAPAVVPAAVPAVVPAAALDWSLVDRVRVLPEKRGKIDPGIVMLYIWTRAYGGGEEGGERE